MPVATDLGRIKLCLSHIPLGTLISVFDSVDPETEPLHGAFAGLGLSGGDDLINVSTKNGTAGVKLDDAIAVMIGLK